jgi:acetyltransferase-like isoleucine patch superfamily enzyme
MKQFLWKTYLRLTHPTCSIHAASISRNVRLEKGVTLEHGSHIQASHIGKYTYINKYCLVDKNTLSIGRFCSIGYNVRIGLGNHPSDWVSSHPFAYHAKYGFVKKNKSFSGEVQGNTVIGNDVWIGANSIILAGVKVGDGAIIGANSLVNADVEPYSVVVGSPARLVRHRFDNETIGRLLNLKWWDWDDEKIREHIDDFEKPERLLG